MKVLDSEQGTAEPARNVFGKQLKPRQSCAASGVAFSLGTETENKMGAGSVDLLVTLQILPGFFSNCLFLALYDSVVLVKRVVSLLSCPGGGGGEWQRMLTSAGLRSIWNSFLLDAYKQVMNHVVLSYI